MRLIEYNVFRRDTRSASGKAKYDASDILESMGFERMYEPVKCRPLRVFQQAIEVMRVSRDSVVAVQYPGNKAIFNSILHSRGIQTIAIIHDIDALRDASKRRAESKALRAFDCVITHNASMTRAVRELGCEAPIVELGLFDYLANNSSIEPNRDDRTVAFAGNFSKAAFVSDLGKVRGITFNLYGVPEPEIGPEADNVYYRGSYPSEEIASRISGKWGLVWDGDSLETCSGPLGEYLRFNCPHKASMYVVAGRPLIVWSESAIARIVEREGIGIAVPSIYAASEAVSAVSDEEYGRMVANVSRVRGELVAGEHLRSAMSVALDRLAR